MATRPVPDRKAVTPSAVDATVRSRLRRLAPVGEALVVAAVVGWMLWVRLSTYDRFVADDAVHFIGTDPYYHLRAVLVSVAHFPEVLRWDPFTYFPNGTETGQFGTLFDLLIALAAKLTGDPADASHVARVVAFAPAVFGALIAVPVYLVGRRLGGRVAAFWSVLVLALLPGEFLIRSLAAYSDHHVAEALFSTVAIAGVLWACDAGRRLGTGLSPWKVFLPSLAGSVGLFLYLWTWPPGVLFVAILGLWVLGQILLDRATGGDTRGFAYAMALSFGGAALLMLVLVEKTTFAFNLFSLIQPLSLAAVAVSALALDAGGRLAAERKLHPAVLPAASAVAGFVALLGLSAFVPSLYGILKWGFSWITGVGATANILTIQEARASCAPSEAFPFCGTFSRSYGLTLVGALAALVVLSYEVARRRRPVDLLLALWLAAMMVASTTQVRFNYYLAIPVALANGYLLHWVARTTGFLAALAPKTMASDPARRGGRKTRAAASARTGLRWHQPVALGVVALLVVPGLVVPTARTIPAHEMADVFRPDHEVVLWHAALGWMKANTPPVSLDLRSGHDRPDGKFAYPPGTYGVLAWWDYGHWIQVLGERPPVANPFQQAAPFASLYFTGSEAEAERALDAWTDGDPYSVRYVATSVSDAAGKYGAITVWANLQNASRPRMGEGLTSTTRTYLLDGDAHQLRVLGPAYRNGMMSRLYFDDANGLEHYRIVYGYPGYNVVGSVASADGTTLCFHNIVLGGCPYPIDPTAIRTYRSADAEAVNVALPGDPPLYLYDFRVVPSLSIFEHVRGATLTGVAAPGSEVTAVVRVEMPATDGMRGFDYSRRTVAGADGTWSLVVSYSTTEPVPVAEGGTTLVAKAVGPYRVTTADAVFDVDVPDRSVLEGGTVTVS